MSIGLLSAARAAGRTSLQQLRTTVGSTSTSAREVAQIALLHKAFLAAGGARGRMGLPLTTVSRLSDGSVARRYERGEMRLTASGNAIVVNEKRFIVHFVGLECMRESSHDQSTASDEPFVLWFVQSGSIVTPTNRVSFKGINTGSQETVSDNALAGPTNHVGLPLIINAVVMEHDSGDRDKAAQRLNELARDAVGIANEVIDQINNYSGSTKIERLAEPVGMAKLGGLVASLFGLEDDFVGTGIAEVFIVKPGETLAALNARVGNTSFTQSLFKNQATYTHSFEVSRPKEGRYRLYFRVEIEHDPNNSPT
jgi:hypothetical protein